MPSIAIETESGTAFVGASDKIVCSLAGNVTVVKSADHLKEGDIVYHTGEYRDLKIENIHEMLMEDEHLYKGAFDYIHTKNEEGSYETFMQSLLGEAFDEIDISLEKIGEKQFSDTNKLDLISDALDNHNVISSGTGRQYSRASMGNWLNGKVLKPTENEVLHALSDLNQEFERWYKEFEDKDTGKAYREYTFYVNTRRLLRKYLIQNKARLESEGGGESVEIDYTSELSPDISQDIKKLIERFVKRIAKDIERDARPKKVKRIHSITPGQENHESQYETRVKLSSGLLTVSDPDSLKRYDLQEISQADLISEYTMLELSMSRIFELLSLQIKKTTSRPGIEYTCSAIYDILEKGPLKDSYDAYLQVSSAATDQSLKVMKKIVGVKSKGRVYGRVNVSELMPDDVKYSAINAELQEFLSLFGRMANSLPELYKQFRKMYCDNMLFDIRKQKLKKIQGAMIVGSLNLEPAIEGFQEVYKEFKEKYGNQLYEFDTTDYHSLENSIQMELKKYGFIELPELVRLGESYFANKNAAI